MTDKPESARQQKTRLIFIQAFLRLIAEHSFDSITITDIANEANYGRWAFYQYFQSKEEVAYAAFVQWMVQLDARVIAAVQDLDSPQREYESWRIIFRAVEQQRVFFTRLSNVTITVWRTRVKGFLVQQFLQHLREGRFSLMEGVRPEVAARLYVASMMELLDYWESEDNSRNLDELIDEFFIFIFKHPPPKSN